MSLVPFSTGAHVGCTSWTLYFSRIALEIVANNRLVYIALLQ